MLCSIFQCNARSLVSFVALKAIDQKFLFKSTEYFLFQKPLAMGGEEKKVCKKSGPKPIFQKHTTYNLWKFYQRFENNQL